MARTPGVDPGPRPFTASILWSSKEPRGTIISTRLVHSTLIMQLVIKSQNPALYLLKLTSYWTCDCSQLSCCVYSSNSRCPRIVLHCWVQSKVLCFVTFITTNIMDSQNIGTFPFTSLYFLTVHWSWSHWSEDASRHWNSFIQ